MRPPRIPMKKKDINLLTSQICTTYPFLVGFFVLPRLLAQLLLPVPDRVFPTLEPDPDHSAIPLPSLPDTRLESGRSVGWSPAWPDLGPAAGQCRTTCTGQTPGISGLQLVLLGSVEHPFVNAGCLDDKVIGDPERERESVEGFATGISQLNMQAKLFSWMKFSSS